eukprot:TRINITY_DN74378_c0_g1_i1.p1 TRINITY_DN74378_c0_g1~~TRINITY_DN74378_c0_g1_i1.p1  ORF type:complete len:188 (-),score=28.07 TRINITY_DN74378_c0_g1_i1:705-1268(-)
MSDEVSDSAWRASDYEPSVQSFGIARASSQDAVSVSVDVPSVPKRCQSAVKRDQPLLKPIGTVKYISPPISPTQYCLPKFNDRQLQTVRDGPRKNASDGFNSASVGSMPRSSSAPQLERQSAGQSQKGNGRSSPNSRAGRSKTLKAGVSADICLTKPTAKFAGVVQSELNPSIPFSGFPSLNFLRGS